MCSGVGPVYCAIHRATSGHGSLGPEADVEKGSLMAYNCLGAKATRPLWSGRVARWTTAVLALPLGVGVVSVVTAASAWAGPPTPTWSQVSSTGPAPRSEVK